MKAIDVLRCWQGEQQSKTEGTWLKISYRNTFLVAQRSTVQWKNLLSGRGKQILGGQRVGGIKLLENKTKHPSLSIGESKLLTKPWEKILLGRSSWRWLHLYQHMNRNHKAILCRRGYAGSFSYNPDKLQFRHHYQGCPSLQTYCIQSPVSQQHICMMWPLNKMLYDNGTTGHQTVGFLLKEPRKTMFEPKWWKLRRETKTQNFLHAPNAGIQQNAILHCTRYIGGACIHATASLYSSLIF